MIKDKTILVYSTVLRLLFIGIYSSLAHSSITEENLRERHHSMGRNYQIYGNQKISFHGAQSAAYGNFINRMDSYFGIQGVSIFNPYELNRAVQKDTLQRAAALRNINTRLDQKIRDLNEKAQIEINGLVYHNGELATLDKNRIRETAGRLQDLGKDSENLEGSIRSDFKERYRGALIPPYLEKPEVILNVKKLNQTEEFYLHGNGDSKGVAKLTESFYAHAGAFKDLADRIAMQEDKMKKSLADVYILAGVGLTASIITFGAAAVPAAQLASGAGIAGGFASFGQSLRTHAVLEQKGLEGFQSLNEKRASLGLFAFQSLASAVSLGSNLYSLNQQIKHVSNLSVMEKLYIDHQSIHSVLSGLELTGLSGEIFGKNGNQVIHGVLSASDAAFGYTNTDKKLQAKIMGSPFEQMVQHPDPWIKKLALERFGNHPFSKAASMLEMVSGFSSFNSGLNQWFGENRFGLELGIQALRLGQGLDASRFQTEIVDKTKAVELAEVSALRRMMVQEYPPIQTKERTVYFGDWSLKERRSEKIAAETIGILLAHKYSWAELEKQNFIPLRNENDAEEIVLISGTDSQEISRAYQFIKSQSLTIPNLKNLFPELAVQNGKIEYQNRNGERTVHAFEFIMNKNSTIRYVNDPVWGWKLEKYFTP